MEDKSPPSFIGEYIIVGASRSLQLARLGRRSRRSAAVLHQFQGHKGCVWLLARWLVGCTKIQSFALPRVWLLAPVCMQADTNFKTTQNQVEQEQLNRPFLLMRLLDTKWWDFIFIFQCHPACSSHSTYGKSPQPNRGHECYQSPPTPMWSGIFSPFLLIRAVSLHVTSENTCN